MLKRREEECELVKLINTNKQRNKKGTKNKYINKQKDMKKNTIQKQINKRTTIKRLKYSHTTNGDM